MSDTHNDRYEDILRRIANRQPFSKTVNDHKTSPYDSILDKINAYDLLSSISTKSYTTLLVNGPRTFHKKNWSTVLLWYRPKGYYGYKTISLLGVWVHQSNTDILLTIGIRHLNYQATIYNPEGYFTTIQKEFQLFYGDDGHPPTTDDTLLFQTIYQAKERLTYRQTLSQICSEWQQNND